MDPLGSFTLMASIVCYLLAMQWGGITKAWNSSGVVGVLVGWLLLTICFAAIQMWRGEYAIVVPRLIKKRTVAAGCVFNFLLAGAYFIFIYYLPIYFQAIGGSSAVKSGIQNLPLILGSSFASIVGGLLLMKIGYYQPFFMLGAALTALGSGLLYTSSIHPDTGRYVGFQLILGLGVGLCIQVPVVASQTIVDAADIAPTTATLLCF
ncbi:General substrate transporter [Macrophomina phaseolina MS6]|uniref:General substrate transporter n=1 Tax=Macrophomina phaseolina (strain MS6) TaxID=1126212 RepID=K2R217_MACPH|nr:General substrate transporter [Macrophomina phaseolina MS6]